MSVAADARHLVHEAREEDGVARLVDLLGGEEVLLLLARRGVDVGREAVGHGVLAPEEQRVVPQRRLALEIAELLLPLAGVFCEVDLGRAPVALLPARVEVLVGDCVGRRAHRYICSHERYKCTERLGSARAHPARDARADRRARARRGDPPRRGRAGRAAAVRHDLLVRVEGRAAAGDADAGRARGGGAARAARARARAARARRGRVGRARWPPCSPPTWRRTRSVTWPSPSSCSRARAVRGCAEEVARWHAAHLRLAEMGLRATGAPTRAPTPRWS